MTNRKPIYVTENNGNFFFLKFYKYYLLPGFIILSGMTLWIFFRITIMNHFLINNGSAHTVPIKDITFLLLLFIILFLTSFCLDLGKKPLILYEDGMEEPQADLSFNVLKRKMNKIPLMKFYKYSEIDKINTYFKNGELYAQRLYSDEHYPNSEKKVILSELHPPLAKEIMRALKDIVGTNQLVRWLEKGEMIFRNESPECHIRAMEVQRDLLGDDVVEKLYRKKGNTLEYTMNPANARHE